VAHDDAVEPVRVVDVPRVEPAPPEVVPPPPPPGFTDLALAVPGIVLDIRYATPNNFTGAPLPGYARPRAWMRDAAAAALARVQADLAADGLGLRVFDAYRPSRATAAMVRWARSTRRDDLLRDGYIAARSKHNQGVAIDLTLCDLATGEPLPMGTEFDVFDPSAHVENAKGDALRNRHRLRRAMQAHGFASYAKEWWHFVFVTDDETPAIDIEY
jgi:D-alanyl-D-alanine dipeptidase